PRSYSAASPREDGLGHHGVYAFPAVHELRDPEVEGERAQRVGVDGLEAMPLRQPTDHVPGRDLRGLVQVLEEAHRDDVGRRLRHGALDPEVPADLEAELADERRLGGAEVDLAVALRGVPVADGEEGAAPEDG